MITCPECKAIQWERLHTSAIDPAEDKYKCKQCGKVFKRYANTVGNPFNVGDKVYKNYPFDGTPKQGYPDKSRTFTIVKIDDFAPVDGRHETKAVCHLKPGVSWAFWQYLTKA